MIIRKQVNNRHLLYEFDDLKFSKQPKSTSENSQSTISISIPLELSKSISNILNDKHKNLSSLNSDIKSNPANSSLESKRRKILKDPISPRLDQQIYRNYNLKQWYKFSSQT
jgi:hypothetical protein